MNKEKIIFNVIHIPPYNLTVPKEFVNEIELEKPEEKHMFIDFLN